APTRINESPALRPGPHVASLFFVVFRFPIFNDYEGDQMNSCCDRRDDSRCSSEVHGSTPRWEPAKNPTKAFGRIMSSTGTKRFARHSEGQSPTSEVPGKLFRYFTGWRVSALRLARLMA